MGADIYDISYWAELYNKTGIKTLKSTYFVETNKANKDGTCRQPDIMNELS